MIVTVFGIAVYINRLIDPTIQDTNRLAHRPKLIDKNGPKKESCRVEAIYGFADSGLKKIQDERKSRLRDVCNMCRRNRTSMECNHVTMDEDYHRRFVYTNLLVNDKHKVHF